MMIGPQRGSDLQGECGAHGEHGEGEADGDVLGAKPEEQWGPPQRQYARNDQPHWEEVGRNAGHSSQLLFKAGNWLVCKFILRLTYSLVYCSRNHF